MKGRSLKSRLEYIKTFSDAGVKMGHVHRERAYEEFEQTGESGYNEGWAAGFLQAMEVMNEFISREVQEAKEDEAAA